VGLAERADVVVLQRLAVQLRDGVVDRLLEHDAAAEPLVDDPRRHVPGPEAGNPDLFADLPVGLVEAGLELGERNLDGQLDPGRAELLDIGLHGGVTPWSPASCPPRSRRRETRWAGAVPAATAAKSMAAERLGLSPSAGPGAPVSAAPAGPQRQGVALGGGALLLVGQPAHEPDDDDGDGGA